MPASADAPDSLGGRFLGDVGAEAGDDGEQRAQADRQRRYEETRSVWTASENSHSKERSPINLGGSSSICALLGDNRTPTASRPPRSPIGTGAADEELEAPRPSRPPLGMRQGSRQAATQALQEAREVRTRAAGVVHRALHHGHGVQGSPLAVAICTPGSPSGSPPPEDTEAPRTRQTPQTPLRTVPELPKVAANDSPGAPVPSPPRDDDWFSSLFGFADTGTQDVRNWLRISQQPDSTWSLSSSVNGAKYGAGDFEVLTLNELRRRVAEGRAGQPTGTPHCSVRVETRSMMECQASVRNQNATFQVPSRIDFEEPPLIPIPRSSSVSNPVLSSAAEDAAMCAWACGPAAFYRKYFVRQTNGAKGVSKHVGMLVGMDASLGEKLFEVYEGRASASEQQLSRLEARLGRNSVWRTGAAAVIRVGVHKDAEVVSTSSSRPSCCEDRSPDKRLHRVTQVLCALPPGGRDEGRWESFSTLVLQASFEATLWAAMLNAARLPKEASARRVFLSCFGATGNATDCLPASWLVAALRRALQPFLARHELDVRIVTNGEAPPELLQFLQEIHEDITTSASPGSSRSPANIHLQMCFSTPAGPSLLSSTLETPRDNSADPKRDTDATWTRLDTPALQPPPDSLVRFHLKAGATLPDYSLCGVSGLNLNLFRRRVLFAQQLVACAMGRGDGDFAASVQPVAEACVSEFDVETFRRRATIVTRLVHCSIRSTQHGDYASEGSKDRSVKVGEMPSLIVGVPNILIGILLFLLGASLGGAFTPSPLASATESHYGFGDRAVVITRTFSPFRTAAEVEAEGKAKEAGVEQWADLEVMNATTLEAAQLAHSQALLARAAILASAGQRHDAQHLRQDSEAAQAAAVVHFDATKDLVHDKMQAEQARIASWERQRLAALEGVSLWSRSLPAQTCGISSLIAAALLAVLALGLCPCARRGRRDAQASELSSPFLSA